MNIHDYVMLQLALGNKVLDRFNHYNFIFIVQTNLFIERDSKKLYPVIISVPVLFTEFWERGKHFVHRYKIETYNVIGYSELFDNPDEFIYREKHHNRELTYSVQLISEWMKR